MARKRWKRKSGYVTPDLTIPKKLLIKENLFLNPHYDDWNEYRDGMRDWYGDFKLIKKIKHKDIYPKLTTKRIKMNKKQIKLLKRRKARAKKRLLR